MQFDSNCTTTCFLILSARPILFSNDAVLIDLSKLLPARSLLRYTGCRVVSKGWGPGAEPCRLRAPRQVDSIADLWIVHLAKAGAWVSELHYAAVSDFALIIRAPPEAPAEEAYLRGRATTRGVALLHAGE